MKSAHRTLASSIAEIHILSPRVFVWCVQVSDIRARDAPDQMGSPRRRWGEGNEAAMSRMALDWPKAINAVRIFERVRIGSGKLI